MRVHETYSATFLTGLSILYQGRKCRSPLSSLCINIRVSFPKVKQKMKVKHEKS